MSLLLQPVFTQLWHSNPAVRLDASVQLVGHLEEAQKSSVAATGDATTDAEEARTQQVDGLAPDVAYTLKRLIRGLASPRESSRLGFAVALTELLTRITDILPRQVYPLLKSSSEIASGSKGPEERDLLFARLFGVHAIASSGFLFRSTSSLYDWRVAVEEVLYLGERKAWLRESAGWVIQGATRQLLQREDVEWKAEALQVLIEAAFKRSEGGVLDWTPERLALAIMLQYAGVEADWSSITKPAFAEPQLLSSVSNLPTIARILRGLSADETSKKANEQAQSAYLGTTQLHFVWTEILNVYFGSKDYQSKQKKAKAVNGETPSKPVPFLDFYKVAVDGNLFTETASIPAKYVGLMAFKACLTTVDAATIPHLFTQNVLRTLMNHLAKGDRTLHGVAVQIAKTIPAVAQSKQSIAYDILLKLFNPPVGTIRFDALTRTKTVEGLVAALDVEGIKKYSNWLMTLIIEGDLPSAAKQVNEEDMAEDEDEEDTETKTKDVENRRLWAIDQLGLLVRKHAKALPLEAEAKALTTSEYSWITRVLQFLIVHGFTKVLKTTKKSDIEALRVKPEEPFSTTLQQAFRSRFFAALSHLITVNTKCRSEPWAKQCLHTLLALQKDTKHVSPLTPQESVDSIAPAVKLLTQINSLADKQKAQYLSLFVEVLLLLTFDPTGDAEDFLEQMTDAVEAIINSTGAASSKATTSQQAAEDSDEGEEAEPVSVLIDLLVDLMQKSSALLRTVSERVFAAASGDISEQALQLLLDQIIPETLEMDEDDGEESDDEDEEEAAEGEESTSGKKRKHKQIDAEESDESSDEDEDEDDDDLDLEVDEELRAKILEALKESGVDGDVAEEDEEDDEDDEEEELLDDDQMMELDDKLAEIFKQRKAASKSAKDAMQASHDAQLKVIDLLEIFAKQQSASPLVLHTILPLFNAARRSGKEDIDIASKAHRVLNGITSKAKEYPTVGDTDSVLDILRDVHQGAARSGSEEVEGLAIATSLYLCKIALATSTPKSTSAVTDIYISSLNSFLMKKSCRLHGRFFESFINRYRDAAWQLRDALLEGCSENTETSDKHRRATCFHLLSALLNTHAAIKTPEAKKEVIDFVPKYVQAFIDTFEAATAGQGMALQVIRLREILKACSEAVRATKNAVKGGPNVNTWDLWRSADLSRVLVDMANSKSITKSGSLNSTIRNLMDLINQGSGRAKVRTVKNGEPAMRPTNDSGKPVTKLDGRQIKKAKASADEAEQQSNKKSKKEKVNKRKAETMDAQSTAPAQSLTDDHGASTSEDSD